MSKDIKINFPGIPDDYVMDDYAALILHNKTKVFPPYTETEIDNLRNSFYVFVEFFQERKLLKKKFILEKKDVDRMDRIYARDYTEDGILLHRIASGKYLAAVDRGTQPEKACKSILEKYFKKIETKEII